MPPLFTETDLSRWAMMSTARRKCCAGLDAYPPTRRAVYSLVVYSLIVYSTHSLSTHSLSTHSLSTHSLIRSLDLRGGFTQVIHTRALHGQLSVVRGASRQMNEGGYTRGTWCE